MKQLLSYFLSCLKVGTIGFGGGSALIPVVEQEMVHNKKMLDDEEYLTHTVVANITPGALPVKLGTSIGFLHGGVSGSLLGAYGMAIPGAFLTVLLTAMFALLSERALAIFDYAAVGISAFIVFLLLAYIVKTVSQGNKVVNIGTMLLAFFVTGGSEIREMTAWLFGGEPTGLIGRFVDSKPVFDIPVITLILMAFYLIFYIQRVTAPAGVAGGFVLALGYCFLEGKLSKANGWNRYSMWYLIAILVILALVFLLIKPKEKKGGKVKLHIPKGVWISVAILMGVPVILTVLCAVFRLDRAIPFAGNVVISTVTSFGGGEAYMSVAEGFFVDGGYVAKDLFQTQVVSVANALPGPILVKVASGIGYLFGAAGGSTALGVLGALTAFAASVGACCSVCLIVLALYDSLKESALIMGLKLYILPVICGMLISTALSMLVFCMEVSVKEGGFAPIPSAVALVAAVAAMYALHKKFHKIPDIVILLAAALLSVGVFLLFGIA